LRKRAVNARIDASDNISEVKAEAKVVWPD
jgi:hypothetical protein